jgi:hypothetical protein
MSKRYIDADALLIRLPDDLPYKASVKRVLIQALATDKWISVEENLPPKDYYDFVLAWDSFQKCVVIAHYSHRYECWEDERTLKQYPNKITHWMPLPEPPKESEDTE